MKLEERLLGSITDRSYRLILVFTTIYAVAMTVIPFARLVPRWPVHLLVPLVFWALYRWPRIPEAARRWVYYILLTVTYQALRFVVTTRSDPFHGTGVIAFERAVFGGELPTIWLQSRLHPQPGFAWYDYAFALLHGSLFAFPLVLPAVLLWRRGAPAMKRGTVAIVLLSLSGYLTYVLFPLTPPWMAMLEREVPAMERVVFMALRRLAGSWLTGAFQPSPRGAMPSLHAGLPFMTVLVAFHEFGRRAWWVVLPVAGICFEVVYGAEHYVLDILAGFCYGFAAYWIVYRRLLPDGTGGKRRAA